jgi:imidazolonepropionase-like amidohydrolase
VSISRQSIACCAAIATLAPLTSIALAQKPARRANTAAASLVIRHATVFDVRTLRPRPNTTVVIRGDRIVAVLPDAAARDTTALRTIDGHGRLLTPGLIDVHHHIDYVFPDSITPGNGAVAKFVMRPDSIAAYRARWANEYLPYGVTTVREVGGNDRHLALRIAWMQPSTSAPDLFVTGGALVSPEPGRVPFLGHTVVRDSADAARQVRAYYDAGLRDIKLYWRLREPEYVGAFVEARQLGMHATTHVDFGIMSIQRALALGVRHFEHAYTIGVSILSSKEIGTAWTNTTRALGENGPAQFYWGTFEYFNLIGPANGRMTALIASLARSGATVTPTLHLFAQHVGEAGFVSKRFGRGDNSEAWTPAQRARALAGYRILATYVRELHDAGVQLAVGTDWRDPGRAVLSEMLVLNKAGIPMASVLQIATLGGARVLEREREFGAVDAGYRANLVLFERDPLVDPRALFGPKTVVKSGVVVP